MGRTPLSWLLITIFYIIYYACLAGFWALMLLVFFQFIEEKQPRWQQDASLIGRSPALGVRPGQTWDLIDSSMILFNKEKEIDEEYKVPGWGGWVARTNEFLAEYKKVQSNGIDCANKDLKEDEFCNFPLTNLGPCDSGNFGYDQGEPCILLKLNRIYGLIPEYYNSTDALPEEMPAEIKKRIAEVADKNQVWVSCKGENSADKEGMGDISFHPSNGGFTEEYFPYLNQPNYQSPIVAVKFKNVAVGQFIHVECRAWAKNIGYDKRDRKGIAHFELMIHTTKTAGEVDKA